MFERSWVWIPVLYTGWTFGHFSHWFVVKIVLFVWKDRNKLKRGCGRPIFKKNSKTIVFSSSFNPYLIGGNGGRYSSTFAHSFTNQTIPVRFPITCKGFSSRSVLGSNITHLYAVTAPSIYASFSFSVDLSDLPFFWADIFTLLDGNASNRRFNISKASIWNKMIIMLFRERFFVICRNHHFELK